MFIKDWIDDIRFSIRYDAEQLAKKNEEKYGSNLPDCCRVNRQENEKASGKSRE